MLRLKARSIIVSSLWNEQYKYRIEIFRYTWLNGSATRLIILFLLLSVHTFLMVSLIQSYVSISRPNWLDYQPDWIYSSSECLTPSPSPSLSLVPSKPYRQSDSHFRSTFHNFSDDQHTLLLPTAKKTRFTEDRYDIINAAPVSIHRVSVSSPAIFSQKPVLEGEANIPADQSGATLVEATHGRYESM